MLVSTVVVDAQAHVEFARDFLINPSQETQELMVPVPGLAHGDHRTVGYVQGGKKRGGAMADVVVDHTLDEAQTYGQQRLAAIKGLDLHCLINKKHNCLIRRGEVEPDDVANLLHHATALGRA